MLRILANKINTGDMKESKSDKLDIMRHSDKDFRIAMFQMLKVIDVRKRAI